MSVPKGAKRELRNVRVRFVSLVGKPANMKPFVAKSADGPAITGEVVLFKSQGWEVPALKDEKGPGSRMIGKLVDLVARLLPKKETPSEPVAVTKTKDDGDGVSAALTSLCDGVAAGPSV